jgi:hypothetical protein
VLPTERIVDEAQERPAAPPSGRETEHGRQSVLGVLALAVPLGFLVTWYGFLDGSGSHPALKLGGAMALAAGGTVLVAACPPSAPSGWARPDHSAFVEIHPLTLGVAWASMAAALIHFAVVKQHFSAFYLYGLFFIAVSCGELVWAILVVAMRSRAVLVAGLVGNAALVATWIVTRTYGALIGPEATSRATVGFGDLVATFLEVTVVVGCLVLLRSRSFGRGASSSRGELLSLAVALGITLITVLALYSAVGGPPFVSHVG